MNTLPTFSRTSVHCVRTLKQSSKQVSATKTLQSIIPSRTRSTQLSQNRSFASSSQPYEQHDLSNSSSSTPATNPSEAILSTFASQPQTLISSSSSSSTTAATLKTHHKQQPKLFTGTVTKANTMQNCVQITHYKQVWNNNLRKNYTKPTRLLVHDPNPQGYLREGDVVQYSAWSESEVLNQLSRKANFEADLIEQSNDAGEAYFRKKELAKKQRKFYNSAVKNGKRKTGYHGEEVEKWDGPRYVFRRMITPFGEPLQNRPSAEIVSSKLL